MTRLSAAILSILMFGQALSVITSHEEGGDCAKIESRPITVNYVSESGDIQPRLENAGVCVDNQ